MINDGLLTIVLPDTDGGILLWSQIICLWMFSNYVLGSNPPSQSLERQGQTKNSTRSSFLRTLIFCAVVFLLPGFTVKYFWGRILIVFIVGVFFLILPFGRNLLARDPKQFFNRLTAEWELIVNVLLIASVGYVIAKGSLGVSPSDALLVFPISPARLSICFLIFGAAFFLCDGATHMTRGILFKTGTAPKKTQENELAIADEDVGQNADPNKSTQTISLVDNKEFNRGKYIGNLERLMVLGVVLVGSYETIGFIIAGKGLIRAKEFEDRDFAEYFLIGTLTSVAIAIGVGFLIILAIKSINGT